MKKINRLHDFMSDWIIHPDDPRRYVYSAKFLSYLILDTEHENNVSIKQNKDNLEGVVVNTISKS